MDRRQELEFEKFVHGSGRQLLRTAVLLVGDLGHAEDLVQVALERTARHWTRLAGAPEAYARVVLVRLATDRWRRRSRRVAEVLTDPPESSDRDFATDVVTHQSLINALATLTPRQRAVLILRYFDDLSVEQTADALEVSAGTVKTTAFRAVARLRTTMPALDAELFPSETPS